MERSHYSVAQKQFTHNMCPIRPYTSDANVEYIRHIKNMHDDIQYMLTSYILLYYIKYSK